MISCRWLGSSIKVFDALAVWISRIWFGMLCSMVVSRVACSNKKMHGLLLLQCIAFSFLNPI
jgi:hypothetical protein